MLFVAAGLIVVLLVVAQAVLPGIAGNRIEDRLTQGGGTASVSVSALPAVRLLFNEGQSLTATGSGLNLQPQSANANVLQELDGFNQVNLNLTNFQAGPLSVSRFELTRSGSAPYTLNADATTTGADIANFGLSQFGLPNG